MDLKEEFKDISILSKRYLHNEMTKMERNAFEQLLAAKPEAKKEFEFVQLLIEEIQQIDDKGLRKSTSTLTSWKKQFAKPALLFFMVFTFAALIAYFFFYKKNTPNIELKNLQRRVSEKDNSIENTDLAAKNIGGSINEVYSDRGYGITINTSGDIITAGIFSGTALFGKIELVSKGGTDIFVAFCNQNIEFHQAFRAGSSAGNDNAKNITLDSENNIIITGSFMQTADFGDTLVHAIGHDNTGNADFFIAKYSPNGQLKWIDHTGGQKIPHKQTGLNCGISVTTDLLNNVIVSVNYIGSPRFGNDTLPAGSTTKDILLAKYTPDGSLSWFRTVTATYMATGSDIKTDSAGNIYITGSFAHANLNGSLNFGDTTLISTGGKDIFLAKYSPDGELLWVRQAGADVVGGSEYSRSLTLDPFGNIVIAGHFEYDIHFEDITISNKGGVDFFFAKYDTDGNILWAKSGGGPGKLDNAYDVTTDAKGNILVTGHFTNTAYFDDVEKQSNGKSDAFIAKYDEDGALIWVRTFGGNGNQKKLDLGQSVVNDINGNVVVTGYFSGTVKFGDFNLVSEGLEDIFIIVLDSDGKIISANKLLQLM